MCSGLAGIRFPLAVPPGLRAPDHPRFLLPHIVSAAAGVLLILLSMSAAAPASARPGSRETPRFRELSTEPGPRGAVAGVLGSSAGQDTVYFGGTFWNADSSRWEAQQGGMWTFDSGVGSSFDHSVEGVNPFKDPRLHATMEGWVGIDLTYGGDTPYLRLVSAADPAWEGGTVCVGAGHTVSPGVLSGDWSYYCGVFPAEARDLCYADQANPLGYGNSWRVCIGKTVVTTGAAITLDFNLVWESEPNYDYTTVEIDTTGAGDGENLLTAAAWDGQGAGAQSLDLEPGLDTRSTPGPVQIRFCFTSDGAWSDDDGLFATVCGAFSVDDIALSGGVNEPLVDFEGGVDGGWVRLPAEPGRGGDWSDIVSLDDLPPQLGPCGCNLADSVLVFTNLDTGGHSPYQDNVAASPWIDLKGNGLQGRPGKIAEYRLNAELPLLNYVFYQELIQYYPLICAETGQPRVSPWLGTGFIIYYYGGISACTSYGPIITDWGQRVPADAERVRLAFGVLSLCASQSDCSGGSNTTPWFDDIRFGVFGTAGPRISTSSVHLPQDAFPRSGTLSISAPGRIDCGNVANESSPEVGSILGDTLTVDGAYGNEAAEVHVQFAIAPGPGIDTNRLNAFYNTVSFQETRRGLDWYSARMDTAEWGGYGAYAGTWMTAFHEEDPGFSGSDTDLDPYDPTPAGTYPHLKNDIFPDDLLTPGSRLMLFYRSRYLAGSEWYLYPDTTGGNYLEMEVLPSSMEADGTFNCVLYVDHFDRGGQGTIENGLAAVLPGGSANFENTAWDRWDVRAASSQQSTLGRPLQTEYGASLIQLMGYTTIVWDSGNLNAFNVVKEDADILIPWLALPQVGGNGLYLTGDGVANSMADAFATDASATLLLTEVCGATRLCNTFRDQGCPEAASVQDYTNCLQLNPSIGARVATRPLGGIQAGEGNGCPRQRSFDVVVPNLSAAYGNPVGDEIYVGDVKSAAYASVTNVSDVPNGARFKTVVDGLSIQRRRDSGDCVEALAASPQAVEERFREVLGWFGTIGNESGCVDVTRMTRIPPKGPRYTTALAPIHPNPLTLGTGAAVRFSLAEEGPATLTVFDLQGRRMKTIFDGTGKAGWNEAIWDGTDETARPVASGVYFYRLRTPQRIIANKMVVVRGR